MLKLLLCSALTAPCIIVPFMGSTSDRTIDFKKVSYEEAYVEPEFTQLEKCKTAELDVFFHENYITTHSAEYIAEGIELSEDCKNVNYIITPVVPSTSGKNNKDITDIHAEELAEILQAHGVSATIGRASVEKSFDSLTANGRTAILKIAFSEGDNA